MTPELRSAIEDAETDEKRARDEMREAQDDDLAAHLMGLPPNGAYPAARAKWESAKKAREFLRSLESQK